MENECNLVEDKSILASIDESSADNNSDEEYKSTDDIKKIWYGTYVNTNNNARDARLKICEHIRQAQSEWKRAELSEKRTGKGLHKVYEVVVKY